MSNTKSDNVKLIPFKGIRSKKSQKLKNLKRNHRIPAGRVYLRGLFCLRQGGCTSET